MTASAKTLHKQSFALNALKNPQTANPQPSLASQEAYRYMMRFNTHETSAVNILEELPGLANVVIHKKLLSTSNSSTTTCQNL
jgi:hypothetical protein